MGSTLKELERLNGKPFRMVIWGSDVGGGVVSFDGGALASFDGTLRLRLEPRTDAKGHDIPELSADEKAEVYDGERIVASSNPVLQKVNPRVHRDDLRFSAWWQEVNRGSVPVLPID